MLTKHFKIEKTAKFLMLISVNHYIWVKVKSILNERDELKMYF